MHKIFGPVTIRSSYGGSLFKVEIQRVMFADHRAGFGGIILNLIFWGLEVNTTLLKWRIDPVLLAENIRSFSEILGRTSRD